jgi:hypothetical protein
MGGWFLSIHLEPKWMGGSLKHPAWQPFTNIATSKNTEHSIQKVQDAKWQNEP